MKTENVEKLVKEGKLKEALLIAGKFKRTFNNLSSDQLYQLQTAYGCLTNANFYKGLGKDLELEINKAYKILENVFGANYDNKKYQKIKNQLDKLLEYIPRTTIAQEEIITIIGVESAIDKNILLNIIKEYKENGILESNRFGLYNEGGAK